MVIDSRTHWITGWGWLSHPMMLSGSQGASDRRPHRPTESLVLVFDYAGWIGVRFEGNPLAATETQPGAIPITSGSDCGHTRPPCCCLRKTPMSRLRTNRAERNLQMSKVKQTVSAWLRKVEFAQAYCRISSYLQTMANQGCNPLCRHPNCSIRGAVRGTA
jgi:hypothetical protein